MFLYDILYKSNDFFLIRKIFEEKTSHYATNFVFLQLKSNYGSKTDAALSVCWRK